MVEGKIKAFKRKVPDRLVETHNYYGRPHSHNCTSITLDYTRGKINVR